MVAELKAVGGFSAPQHILVIEKALPAIIAERGAVFGLSGPLLPTVNYESLKQAGLGASAGFAARAAS
jgi:hypothetical protein